MKYEQHFLSFVTAASSWAFTLGCWNLCDEIAGNPDAINEINGALGKLLASGH